MNGPTIDAVASLRTVEAARILSSFRDRGIHLWVEDGTLRYRALKGSLTPSDKDLLRNARDQLAATLESVTAVGADEMAPGIYDYRGPLSFSQRWHWNLFKLGTRRSARHVVAALRLQGTLDVTALRTSLRAVVDRHDALRTQIVMVNDEPAQEIRSSVSFELEEFDLCGASAPEQQARRLIDEAILEPIDLATDRLFAFRLLRLKPTEHVLVVTLEHLISDGFSMNVLLRDVFAAYEQARRHRTIVPPKLPIQFAEYARWQHLSLSSWQRDHEEYWRRRLAGYRPVRAPADRMPTTGTDPGWGAVPVSIPRELRRQLSVWSRSNHTTIAMSVLTAYVALIMRWCNTSDLVIQHQINNRNDPALQDTIGYFTSILFLRMEIGPADTFIELLAKVIHEYCQAHEHVDANYIAAQLPRPAFAHANWFNWIPLEPKLESAPDSSLAMAPMHFANPAVRTFDWDNDPEFVLFDTEDEVLGTVYFPLSRFSEASIAALVDNFIAVTTLMVQEPTRLASTILLR